MVPMTHMNTGICTRVHNRKDWIGGSLIAISILALVLTAIMPIGVLSGVEGSVYGRKQVTQGHEVYTSAQNVANTRLTASDLGVEAEYVIITPQEWEAYAMDIADWKTTKGIPTDVVTLEFIQNNVYGRDLGEKVHNYLTTTYQYNPSLHYVLLFGDSEVIPPRYIYTGCAQYGQTNFVYSDYYYAALDSNWDTDGDGIYGEEGEEDLTPELVVGRLPVSNAAEAQRAASRAITYEKNPPEGDWVHRGLIAGGLMYAPNAADYDPESDNAYKVQKKVVPKLRAYFNLTELYDYPNDVGGQYIPEGVPGTTDNLNPDAFKSAFNQGCAVVNAVTQGYMSSKGLGDYADDGYTWDANSYSHYLFSYDDADSSTNGLKLPLVYVSSCSVGNFTKTDDTDLETLLTAPSGGAIGLIAGVDLTYRGESANGSYGNWWLNERFWEIFVNETQYMGDALYELKTDYYNERYMAAVPVPKALIKSNIYSYHLLGEPTLMVWRGGFQEATLHSPLTLYTGTHDYTFTVVGTDSKVINTSIKVCLMGDGYYRIFDTTSTQGEGGSVSIDIPEGITSLNVTITGQGILPISTTIAVGEAPPNIHMDSVDLVNTMVLGQEYTLTAKVSNQGSVAINGVEVAAYADVMDSSSVLATAHVDIEPGGEATVELPITLMAHGAHTILVVADPNNLITELDEGDNTFAIDVQVTAPDLMIGPGDVWLNATPQFDEDVEIQFRVENGGDADAHGVVVWVMDGPMDSGVLLGGLGPYDIPQGHGIEDNYTIPSIDHEINVYVYVDPDNAVMEIDEDNNNANLTLKPNHPPSIATIPEIYAKEDTPLYNALDLDEYCTDNDGPEPLSYRIIRVSDDNVSANLNGSVLDIIPGGNFYGNVTVIIGVSDGLIEMGAIVRIMVEGVNDPPVLLSPTNGTTIDVEVGKTMTLDINAVDVDGDSLSFSCSSDLDLSIDTGRERISYIPGYDDIGLHKATITVSDGVYSAEVTVTIRIYSTNNPPTIDPVADMVATVGKAFEYQIIASDRDGDTLHYTLESDIGNISADTGLISFTPKVEDVGVHEVRVIVSDGKTSATVTFHITVQESGNGGGGSGSGDVGGSGGGWDAVSIAALTIAIALFLVVAIFLYKWYLRRI